MYYLRELGIKAKTEEKRHFTKTRIMKKLKRYLTECVKNAATQDLIIFLLM